MKKLLKLLAFGISFFAMQSFVVPAKESRVNVSLVKIDPKRLESPFGITLKKFTELSPTEFSAITGKKMNIFGKIEFRAMQHRIKRDLRKHPDASWSNYVTFNSNGDAKFRFNWGGFALGFLLWPIGVLITIFAFEDKQAWKSALIGMGLGVLLAALILRNAFFQWK